MGWLGVPEGRPGKLRENKMTSTATPQEAAPDDAEQAIVVDLAERLERFQTALSYVDQGVIFVDKQYRVSYLNSAAEGMTGWTLSAACGRPAELVFRALNDRGLNIRHQDLEDNEESLDRPIWTSATLLARDCGRQAIEFFKAWANPRRRDVGGAILVFRNVSEKRELSREIEFRATRDYLTGLLNRDDFERRLQDAVQSPARQIRKMFLLVIDLDDFKLVNDAAGHAAGDQVLQQVVSLIRRSICPVDQLFRIGGNEFALLAESRNLASAEVLARRICQRIADFRFYHERQRLHLSASIGLVCVDHLWTSSRALLRAADMACFAAKEAGRNRVQTYVSSDSAIEGHRSHMRWAHRLVQALDQNRFVLYWQQIHPLAGESVVHFGEVLLRMIDDDGQIIAPGGFLPAAERFHMMTRIDRWVVRNVFSMLAARRESLSSVLGVSVNLSGQSIGDPDFHVFVAEQMREFNFDTSKLCFEITETTAITNLEQALSFCEMMREFGVRFSLDDFGAGVSSFGYLKQLPVDYLKIDGQFIREMTKNPLDQATVRCICEVARVTGKQVVAEFVETEEVEQMLRDMGVDYTQGYYRHKPMPIGDVLAFCDWPRPVAATEHQALFD